MSWIKVNVSDSVAVSRAKRERDACERDEVDSSLILSAYVAVHITNTTQQPKSTILIQNH